MTHSRYQLLGDTTGRSISHRTRQHFPERFRLSGSSEAVMGLQRGRSRGCHSSSAVSTSSEITNLQQLQNKGYFFKKTPREHHYESFTWTQSWSPSTAHKEVWPMQQEFPHTEDTAPHLSCHPLNLHVTSLKPITDQNFPPLSPPAHAKFTLFLLEWWHLQYQDWTVALLPTKKPIPPHQFPVAKAASKQVSMIIYMEKTYTTQVNRNHLFLYIQHPFSIESIKILQLMLLVLLYEDLLCFGAIFPLLTFQYNMLVCLNLFVSFFFFLEDEFINCPTSPEIGEKAAKAV